MILGGGTVVNNAYQTYLALIQSQSEGTNQRVIYVPQKKITNEAPPTTLGLRTLPGTQKLHMVYPKPGYPGVLVCNDLSCTCLVCITDQEEPCYYSRYRRASFTHRLVGTGESDSGSASHRRENTNTCIIL